MLLRHATTRQAWQTIQTEGLRVACADPSAKIQGVWLHSPAQSAWAIVHTMRKHGAALEDVVVLEVRVGRTALRRFKRGLWWTAANVPAVQIIQTMPGATFGASAS